MEVAEGPLSFKEHMWDRFEFLVTKRLAPSRKMLEAVVVCMRERALVERQYARGLAQCASRLEVGPSDTLSVPVSFESIRANLQHRADQSAELAEELEQDIAATIEIVLRQHNEVARRAITDGQRLIRHYAEAIRHHEQAAARYAQVCLEAKESAKECLKCAPLQPQVWKRMAELTVRSSLRLGMEEKEYHQAVEQLNAAASLHEQQMGQVFQALQDMEEKRALCLRDAMMKMAVFDTSWSRNVQYDLDSAVQAVEEVPPLDDLQSFILNNRSKAKRPGSVQPRPRKELAGVRRANVAASLAPPSSSPSEDSGELLQRRAEAMRAELRAALGPKLSSSSSLVADAVPLRLRRAATTRAAFISAVWAEIPQEPGDDGAEASRTSRTRQLEPVLLDRAVFATVATLFEAALDGCDQEGDAWNGRDLLVLAQLCQTDAEDGSRVNLLLKLYNHPLWSRVTFWEDVLLVGIAEAHAEQCLEQDPGTDSQAEGVALDFLQRYIGYMTALGIKEEQARGCAERTVRRLQPLLGRATEVYLKLVAGDGNGPFAKAAPAPPPSTPPTVSTNVIQEPPPASSPSPAAENLDEGLL